MYLIGFFLGKKYKRQSTVLTEESLMKLEQDENIRLAYPQHS
jgi:hypothetical protein